MQEAQDLLDQINSSGIDELISNINEHKKILSENDIAQVQRQRMKVQCIELFERKFHDILKESLDGKENLDAVLDEMLLGDISAADMIEKNIDIIMDLDKPKLD